MWNFVLTKNIAIVDCFSSATWRRVKILHTFYGSLCAHFKRHSIINLIKQAAFSKQRPVDGCPKIASTAQFIVQSTSANYTIIEYCITLTSNYHRNKSVEFAWKALWQIALTSTTRVERRKNMVPVSSYLINRPSKTSFRCKAKFINDFPFPSVYARPWCIHVLAMPLPSQGLGGEYENGKSRLRACS